MDRNSPPDYGYLVGKILPQSYSVGFVVLSYVVSYVGALTTLELLHRRTSRRGAYNWYLLVGSSITMGGIGIWCMHYVANRAIILLDANDIGTQISYNAGYTTLSFFVPILVLFASFSLLGTNETTSKVRVVVSGTLAGLAICGMHYLGQAGISNYYCSYRIPNVVGAAVIAVFASITALAVFFALRAAWTNSWWKRAMCAVVLAGAVSGMHWTAALGTQYRFRARVADSQQNLTGKQTVTMVIIFGANSFDLPLNQSIVACALLLGLAMLAQHRRAEQANRAQQVVLACATFDPKGRLMVSPEGLLPSQKITNSYLEQSLDDVFSTSHPVFLWVYRATRNWRGIADLIPAMKGHIRAITATAASRRGSEVSLHSPDPAFSNVTEDYAIIFRELFCISASALAGQINEPLEKIGVLYDEIISTGTTKPGRRGFKIGPSTPKDVESGPPPIHAGRGQLLFVVRRANAAEAANLQASGYRFAEVQNIISILAKSMQIESEELQKHIENMRVSSTAEHILEPGVHLTCFAIRARVKGGFDVLVRKDAKNLLPTAQLPTLRLSPLGLGILQELDGMSVAACLATLRSRKTWSEDNAHVFVTQFYDSLMALEGVVADPFFEEATLISKPISAPCRGEGSHSSAPDRAMLIAFRTIVPIQTQAPSDRLAFTPLSLFKTQQHVYKNAPDHDAFARTIHREFAEILCAKDAASPKLHTLASASHLSLGRSRSRANTGAAAPPNPPAPSLGGIMVSQSVIVDVAEAGADAGVEMHTLGTVGQAMKEDGDVVTFVNELFAACVADS
ncbi:MAG: hypothetical protein M1839_003774 [Geoglossum umbratile]|nr:MAG: hypothetical protein M1839_003774 [Geoglossum umbratile]